MTPYRSFAQNSNEGLMEKQCLLLTSTLKTPMTTEVVQQYIQETASGTSIHRYDALELAFRNTMSTMKLQKIEDERELERAKELEFMSRPGLECESHSHYLLSCEQVSIDRVKAGSRCRRGGRSFRCSACFASWKEGDSCHSCKKAFK